MQIGQTLNKQSKELEQFSKLEENLKNINLELSILENFILKNRNINPLIINIINQEITKKKELKTDLIPSITIDYPNLKEKYDALWEFKQKLYAEISQKRRNEHMINLMRAPYYKFGGSTFEVVK